MKHFKFNVLTLLLLVSVSTLAQQVTVSISIPPPYTPYLMDYVGVAGKLSIQLKNNTRNPLSVKLVGSITGDNGVSLRTRLDYQPLQPLQLNANETRIFRGLSELRGLFDKDNIELQGIDREARILLEGTYNICLQVLEYGTNRPLSFEEPQGCSNPIEIRYVEPPVLINPVCEDTVRALVPQSLIINWSSAIGTPAGATYTLRMVELPDAEANPNVFIDAVTVPFYEQKNIRSTSLVYHVAMPPLQLGKTYGIRISATDPQKRVVFLNEGHGIVCKFTYGKETKPSE
ncbi:MAG: hypothetical protein U0Y10_07800 [Spirosomataceae bacterium]